MLSFHLLSLSPLFPSLSLSLSLFLSLSLSFTHTHTHAHTLERSSPLAADLVMRMLEQEPQLRITAVQALEHPWVKQEV